MTGFVDDLRLALRSLARAPAPLTLAIGTLALGIAATTVIFSAVEGVLINPVRLEDADRYVRVYRSPTGRSSFMAPPTSELAELWRGADSFEQLEPTRARAVTVTGLGPARTVTAMEVTDSFHRLLGKAPVLGRMFTAEETRTGGPDVAVLSYGFWRRGFGERRGVLGETLVLDGRPYEVVGVVPGDFEPPVSAADVSVWLPYRAAAVRNGPTVIGKLAEGATRERAVAELASLTAGHPEAESWTPRVVGAETLVGGGARGPLQLLMAGVIVLLLIATLNVANLLVGRARARTRETAVRAALGASRLRIARQLIVESLLLGAAAGGLGVLLAQWGLAGLQALRPESLDAFDRVTLHGGVLAFAAGLALLTSLLFGLAPVIQGASATGLATLRSGGRPGGPAGGRRFRLGLVVAEVALSAMLLVGAGLLIRTVNNLYRTDPGFRPEGVIRVEVDIPRWKYESRDARAALATQLGERLRSIPGVADAVGSITAPPRAGIFFGTLEIQGRETDAEPGVIYGGSAGPGHFELLGMRILEGRGFTEREARSGEVYVLGETMARRYWGAESPVGSRIRLGETEPWTPVVGVVADVALNGLGTPPDLQMYAPAQPALATTWLVRTEREGGPIVASVRETVQEVDLDLVVNVSLMADEMRASVGRQRFLMTLLLAFAAVAVVLAAVGFYGVLSNLVLQRRREIGIRVSLGADRGRILGLFVRQGVGATAVGLAAGLPAALAGSGLVASQLYGVERVDAVTYAATTVLLLGTGLLASWLPARRAANLDPREVLGEE